MAVLVIVKKTQLELRGEATSRGADKQQSDSLLGRPRWRCARILSGLPATPAGFLSLKQAITFGLTWSQKQESGSNPDAEGARPPNYVLASPRPMQKRPKTLTGMLLPGPQGCGHCAFSTFEVIGALQLLQSRVASPPPFTLDLPVSLKQR